MSELQRLPFRAARPSVRPAESALLGLTFKNAAAAGCYFLLLLLKGQVHKCWTLAKPALLEFGGSPCSVQGGLAWTHLVSTALARACLCQLWGQP